MVPSRFSGHQSALPRTPPEAEIVLVVKRASGRTPCQARALDVDSPDKLETLAAIMDRLREPAGCPWDREQDYGTLRGYLIEECYEVAEALDLLDFDLLQEELGDLLFQIVFLSRIAKEEGRFTIHDVVRGIAEKMIRRHPHVFAEDIAETSDDVLRRWEEIKREEKRGRVRADVEPSVLGGLPRALPALSKAQRLGTKAARVGFDWREPREVLDKIDEELSELRTALDESDEDAVREELGDLLFAVANLARKSGIDPEGALEASNLKFTRRFSHIEARLREQGVAVHEAGLDRLETLWNEAKRDGQSTSNTPIRRNRS